MSLEAMIWALKVADVRDPVAKLVLIGLADHANDDGTATWPAQSTLATYAGVTVRTVYTKLAVLVDCGVIRPGDQRLVEHIRADRRPHVWDLAMDPTGGKLLPGGKDFRAEDGAATGGNLRSHGRKSASDKPSLNRPEPSIRKEGGLREFPDGWEPNEKHREYAAENNIDLTFQAEQFESHNRSKGNKYKNWDLAFRTWLGNAARWSRPRQQPRAVAGGSEWWQP
jgi:hypothetical protein